MSAAQPKMASLLARLREVAAQEAAASAQNTPAAPVAPAASADALGFAGFSTPAPAPASLQGAGVAPLKSALAPPRPPPLVATSQSAVSSFAATSVAAASPAGPAPPSVKFAETPATLTAAMAQSNEAEDADGDGPKVPAAERFFAMPVSNRFHRGLEGDDRAIVVPSTSGSGSNVEPTENLQHFIPLVDEFTVAQLSEPDARSSWGMTPAGNPNARGKQGMGAERDPNAKLGQALDAFKGGAKNRWAALAAGDDATRGAWPKGESAVHPEERKDFVALLIAKSNVIDADGGWGFAQEVRQRARRRVKKAVRDAVVTAPLGVTAKAALIDHHRRMLEASMQWRETMRKTARIPVWLRRAAGSIWWICNIFLLDAPRTTCTFILSLYLWIRAGKHAGAIGFSTEAQDLSEEGNDCRQIMEDLLLFEHIYCAAANFRHAPILAFLYFACKRILKAKKDGKPLTCRPGDYVRAEIGFWYRVMEASKEFRIRNRSQQDYVIYQDISEMHLNPEIVWDVGRDDIAFAVSLRIQSGVEVYHERAALDWWSRWATTFTGKLNCEREWRQRTPPDTDGDLELAEQISQLGLNIGKGFDFVQIVGGKRAVVGANAEANVIKTMRKSKKLSKLTDTVNELAMVPGEKVVHVLKKFNILSDDSEKPYQPHTILKTYKERSRRRLWLPGIFTVLRNYSNLGHLGLMRFMGHICYTFDTREWHWFNVMMLTHAAGVSLEILLRLCFMIDVGNLGAFMRSDHRQAPMDKKELISLIIRIPFVIVVHAVTTVIDQFTLFENIKEPTITIFETGNNAEIAQCLIFLWFPASFLFIISSYIVYTVLLSLVAFVTGKFKGFMDVKHKLEAMAEFRLARWRFVDRILPKWLPDHLKLKYWAQAWNLFMKDLYDRNYLNTAHYDALLLREGRLDAVPRISIVESHEARRRILTFISGLLMEFPEATTLGFDGIPTITTLVPCGEEAVIYTEDDLLQRESSGHCVLEHIITKHQYEWDAFLERQKFNPSAEAFLKSVLSSNLPGDIRGIFPQLSQDEKESIRVWASMRFQPIARSLHGLKGMHTAYEVLCRASHPEWTDEQVHEAVRDKYQLVWGYQEFRKYKRAHETRGTIPKDPEERKRKAFERSKYHDCCIVLKSNPDMEMVFIDTTGEGEGLKWWPILMYPKGENQNHCMPFVDHQYIMAIDCNQDFYVEEAFKVPSALREFALDKRAVIVGYPEHLFTTNWNIVGHLSGLTERVFVTLTHRGYALMGVRCHYGHPDLIDARYIRTHSGLSCPSYVSEDIFMGIYCHLHGYRSLHVEYLQAGKARDCSMLSSTKFYTKISQGGAQVSMSREYQYLMTCTNIGMIKREFLFATTVHQFFKSGFLLKYGILILALSKALTFVPMLTVGTNRSDIWTSAFVFPWYVYLGLPMTVPLMCELVLEEGIIKGTIKTAKWFGPMTAFHLFHMITSAAGFWNGLLSQASYIASGRAFGLSHINIVETLDTYTSSHFFFSIMLVVLSQCSVVTEMTLRNPGIGIAQANYNAIFDNGMVPVYLIFLSNFLVLFLFNPGSLPIAGYNMEYVRLLYQIDLIAFRKRFFTKIKRQLKRAKFTRKKNPISISGGKLVGGISTDLGAQQTVSSQAATMDGQLVETNFQGTALSGQDEEELMVDEAGKAISKLKTQRRSSIQAKALVAAALFQKNRRQSLVKSLSLNPEALRNTRKSAWGKFKKGVAGFRTRLLWFYDTAPKVIEGIIVLLLTRFLAEAIAVILLFDPRGPQWTQGVGAELALPSISERLMLVGQGLIDLRNEFNVQVKEHERFQIGVPLLTASLEAVHREVGKLGTRLRRHVHPRSGYAIFGGSPQKAQFPPTPGSKAHMSDDEEGGAAFFGDDASDDGGGVGGMVAPAPSGLPWDEAAKQRPRVRPELVNGQLVEHLDVRRRAKREADQRAMNASRYRQWDLAPEEEEGPRQRRPAGGAPGVRRGASASELIGAAARVLESTDDEDLRHYPFARPETTTNVFDAQGRRVNRQPPVAIPGPGSFGLQPYSRAAISRAAQQAADARDIAEGTWDSVSSDDSFLDDTAAAAALGEAARRGADPNRVYARHKRIAARRAGDHGVPYAPSAKNLNVHVFV
eukprot:tig00000431_g680.t1